MKNTLTHDIKIIELNQVSFSYGKQLVLDKITFDLHRGDYLGMIGPNGGGKSTLLRIMLGLLKPASGTVKLFGQDIKEFKDWSKIGYVPQKAARFDINFPATVEEVVMMGRYGKRGLFRLTNKNDKATVSSALNHVGMLEFKDKLIGDLSGGQQQRVFIAKALAAEPEVILLDEPTVGVDVKAQEQFYLLLQSLNEKLQLTLVLVSHELDVVAHEATEIACINRNLVCYCKAEELFKSDQLENLYGKEISYILHNHQGRG